MKIKIDGNLIATNIATPSDLVAEIYKDKLKEVANKLASKAKQPNRAKVKIALSDKTLLMQLAEILDEYASIGVCADLQSEPVLKTQREVLFPKDEKYKSLSHCQAFLYYASPPSSIPLDPLDLDGIFGKAYTPQTGSKKRADDDAYKKYFEWFIRFTQKKVNKGEIKRSGVNAFYERYPIIEHALNTSAENFENNIISACDHILNDWDGIFELFMKDNNFTSSNSMKLVKITSTGNDFHKGGKQVLILTFSNGASTPVTKKLVYKPADIEIDYRLVGDTSNMPPKLLPASLQGQKSLMELINGYIPAVSKLNLPTYRILPRNPGSGLQVDANGRIPLQESYGYIQFLTHEPRSDSNGNPINLNLPVGQNKSDWVTDDENVVKDFYRQWGGLLAVASVFSLSDLHHGNVIVHECRPHLIDLEVAFTGTMEGIDGTLGKRGITYEAEPVGGRKRMNPDSPELFITDKGNAQTIKTLNRLWKRNGGGEAIVDPVNYIDDICRGMIQVFEIMESHSEDIKNWMDDVSNVIARFIPYPTKEFYDDLRKYYFFETCVREPEIPVPPNFVKNQGVFAGWFSEAVEKWNNQTETNWPNPRPNYAIQTFPHNFADYLQCDVPSYYHRINAFDLLNARGEKVHLDPTKLTIPEGVTIRAPQRSEYFPESTWGIVDDQLNKMRTEPNKRLNQCLADLQSWFSKDTSGFKDFIKVKDD